MPNYWLLKTEPSTYSYTNLEDDKRTVWDGVGNALALKHIRGMKTGDLAFIYHTGDERKIVGIGEIVSEPYPDPKQDNPRFVVVDIRAKKRLRNTVTLNQVKSRKEFADFALVKIGRLSVVPVTPSQWRLLNEMSANQFA